MTARALAARVLVRVWERGAFASAALDGELRREQPDPRDGALATELVYGVLRTEAALEERLLAAARRRTLKLPPEARAHLFMGAYALLFLDRVPSFAAVSEAVAGVAAAADERASGFANAVLRRIAATPSAERPKLVEAVSASAPGWLRGALRRALGRAGARAYLEAGPVPPPIGLCLAKGEDRAAWVDRLRAAVPHATIEPGGVSPRALLVRGAGDVRRLPGAGSAWIVQEEGSQLVALSLGAQPGQAVLDACAGHGNKSWALSDDVAPDGAVDGADIDGAKLTALRTIVPRVRHTYVVDWRQPGGDVPGEYHRALVDAPCSGVGTLRRRPEIALRRTADDLPRLAALQIEIVRHVAGRVRTGGKLVLSVCSVLREEAEDVVSTLCEPAGGVRLEPAPFDAEPLQALAGDAATLRLLPHVHGTDGYFLASFTVHRS